MQARIVKLLRVHDGSAFMEAGADMARGLPEEIGARIGPYRLLEKIGEGGFGVVWVAEQVEPVRRRVALKIIKLGMDTREVVARFGQERQALAMMDHPNIAKVFDAGATPTGRPFFVMELVQRSCEVPVAGSSGDGSPVCHPPLVPSASSVSVAREGRGMKITDYCDEARLPTADRLRLFIAVCQAVQHAHQKGIIHRDPKPSNILVTLHDGAPVPKVIDFGVAKATQSQRLTDLSFHTQLDQMIGTPLYMSPEQTASGRTDIDTRSDIYSLGVLLYELLTGRTPFDPETMRRASLEEIRRVIREVDPPRPATVLTGQKGQKGRKGLSAPGGPFRPFRPSRPFSPDLDWIAMKALEKDRTRRYETANGLALDIQRHLDSEPVLARPPSRLYRFQRTVQRNRLAFGAGAVVVVALLVALVALIVSRAGILTERNLTESARRAEHAERQKSDAANRDFQNANVRLADTVSLLELERAENFFRDGDAGRGVAQLAATLRRDPANRIAASRLVSALMHRNWAAPDSIAAQHAERIVSARFSPDSENVLTASWDRTAKIHHAFTGRSVVTVRHDAKVNSARYNPDGTAFVTASADGTARIWNAETGEPLTPPLRHGGNVFDAEFSPDGESVLTASEDKTARIWDARSGAVKQEFQGGVAVLMARFHPVGQRVALGGAAGTIRICNANSGEVFFQFRFQLGPVNWLAFSPDGRRLAAAFDGGQALLFNPETGERIGSPLMHNSPVTCGVFSPNSEILVTTSEDGAARLWNAETGHALPTTLHHEDVVRFAEFSPDGSVLATACSDNTLRLWTDITTGGKPYCQPLRERERIFQVAFAPDRRRLVIASASARAPAWEIRARLSPGRGIREGKGGWDVDFGPRGESLLAASADGTAQLWNPRTGEPLSAPVQQHGAEMRWSDLSADGKQIATAAVDGTIRIWDAATSQLIAGPLHHAKLVWTVQFSPDGSRVVSASADGTARVWDARTGEAVTPPLEHADEVLCARFSADGRSAVTASKDGSARVWDAGTGQPVSPPLTHWDRVGWADFSPAGDRVITASADNTARLWDVQTGKPVGTSLRHLRSVLRVVFSPDGRRVLTASLDRTARIWDANSGEPLTESFQHNDSVTQVCFSPDGARVLTGTFNSQARLWDSTTGRPLTEWLEAGRGKVTSACFDPTGLRIATGTQGQVVRVWEFPPVPVPVPAWFITLAEAVAGVRLDAHGSVELFPPDDGYGAAGHIRHSRSDDFYDRVGRWILADPVRRPLDPF